MDIKIHCFENLERQIAIHLKQIQDRQKQRKKDTIKTTRYKIKRISFLNGNLPIVRRNNNYAHILIIKDQINDLIENYFHGKLSYLYDSHDRLLRYLGDTDLLLNYWVNYYEDLFSRIPAELKVPYTPQDMVEALDNGI